MFIVTEQGVILSTESIQSIRSASNDLSIVATYTNDRVIEIFSALSTDVSKTINNVIRKALLNGFNVSFYKDDYEEHAPKNFLEIEELTPQIKKVIVNNTVYFSIEQ